MTIVEKSGIIYWIVIPAKGKKMKKKFFSLFAAVCVVFSACSEKQPDIENQSHYTGTAIVTSFAESKTAQDIPDEPVETPSFIETTVPEETTVESVATTTTEAPEEESTTKTEITTEKTTVQTTTEKTTATTTTTTEQTTPEPVTETTTARTEPPVQSGANSYKTLNYTEVKGVWISYIELSELR